MGSREQSELEKMRRRVRELEDRCEALSDKGERFHRLFETMAQGVVYQDRQGAILSANPAASAILGYDLEDLSGRTSRDQDWEAIHEDGSPFPGEAHPAMRALATGREIRGVVMGVYNPEKQRRTWILINSVPRFRPGEKDPVEVCTTFSDITELKEGQQALVEFEQRVRNSVQASPMGILIYDLEADDSLVLREINPAAETMLGIRSEELVGKTIEQAFPHLERTEVPARFRDVCRTGNPWTTTHIEYQDDRIEGAFEVHATRSRPGRITIFFIEITERKRAEAMRAESERRYRQLFEHAAMGIFRLTPDGHIIDANPAAVSMLGYRPEQLLSMRGEDFIHPDEARELPPEEVLSRAAQGETLRIERRMKNVQGEYLPMKVIVNRIGGTDDILVMFHDLSKLKLTQEKLQGNEAMLASIFRAAPVGIGMTKDRIFTAVNDRMCEMTGYSREELLGKSSRILYINEEEYGAVGKQQVIQFAEYGTGNTESVWVRKDGSAFDVFLSATPFDLEDQDKGVTFTALDITRRKEALAALKESEERFRSVVEEFPLTITVYDAEGNLVMVNKAWEKTFQARPEEVVGKFNMLTAPAVKRHKTYQDVIKAFKGEPGFLPQWRWNPDDFESSIEPIDLRTYFNPVKNAKGELQYVMIIHENITEVLKAEKELNRLRSLLESIVDSMPSVLVGLDVEGRITQWNREAERFTGLTGEQAMARPFVEVLPMVAREMDKVRQSIEEDKPYKDSKVQIIVGKQRRYVDVTVYPLVRGNSSGQKGTVEGAVVRLDDVTDRVRLEEMMIQSEKMASVGGLAAGMAHEINNPLAAILGSAQVMIKRILTELPANVKAAQESGTSLEAIRAYSEKRNLVKMLESIREAGSRASRIVQNMLSFSRVSGGSEQGMVDLAELLDKTLELASNDFDMRKRYDFRMIEIERHYTPDLPFIACDAGQIQQVFLNLLKNGAQAVNENQETRNEPARLVLRMGRENGMMRIEIEDNGAGMSEEVRKRIFEPFFTTKQVGEGTGLGLSVSYFIIVENHGGELTAESTPGRGTRFIIKLPIDSGYLK